MTSALFPLKLAPNLEKSSGRHSPDDGKIELCSFKALTMVGKKKKKTSSCSSCRRTDLNKISIGSAYPAKRRAGVHAI